MKHNFLITNSLNIIIILKKYYFLYRKDERPVQNDSEALEMCVYTIIILLKHENLAHDIFLQFINRRRQ